MLSSSSARTAVSLLRGFQPASQIARPHVEWSGIILLRVPETAAEKKCSSSTGADETFVRFTQVCKGGAVEFRVRGNLAKLRDQQITAATTVLREHSSDGQEVLLVVLNPIHAKAPTHRLALISDASRIERTEGLRVFETPAPLKGAIVIGPPNCKIITQKPVAKVESPTGDRQLDRLLKEGGWQIESQDDKVVNLWKMKDGERKTMEHQRRRPKEIPKRA